MIGLVDSAEARQSPLPGPAQLSGHRSRCGRCTRRSGLRTTVEPSSAWRTCSSASSRRRRPWAGPAGQLRAEGLQTDRMDQGIAGVSTLIAFVEDEGCEVIPPLARAAHVPLVAHLGEIDRQIHVWHRSNELSRRLWPHAGFQSSEAHNRRKIDAPSGTALMLGEAAARGRGVSLPSVERRGCDGVTNERPIGEIGFSVLRGGGIVGEHSVVFAAGEEVVNR